MSYLEKQINFVSLAYKLLNRGYNVENVFYELRYTDK